MRLQSQMSTHHVNTIIIIATRITLTYILTWQKNYFTQAQDFKELYVFMINSFMTLQGKHKR